MFFYIFYVNPEKYHGFHLNIKQQKQGFSNPGFWQPT